MIKILVIITLIICGLSSLLLSENKFVNKQKLNPNQDLAQIVKQTRKMGIIFNNFINDKIGFKVQM